MKISYSWLNQYLPLHLTPEKLSEILTGIGLEVEEVERKDFVQGNLTGLIVGQVEQCAPHPNADKLKVTKVRINDEKSLSIVCGAANVAAGQKVIVAIVGSTLYSENGSVLKIKKAKLRGELSEGMICAEDEIGMGESHEGIMVLPEDTPIGTPAAVYFKIPEPEIVFNIGLTPNRSDANSHLGTAKDVCAYLSYHKQEIILPQQPLINISSEISPIKDKLPIEINVENLEACPRYAGLLIKNIRIAPSPEWLQERLRSVDINPINNIVDITNFVLQEFGQPLHAFDYDKIVDQKIIVKNLTAGTLFKTLDNEDYKLSDEDLMICDGNATPMCMAGVYGGVDSGITESTKNIFLESAYFHPKTIRRTSLRHNLRTDAATHFEKGVAMSQVIPALKRAADLIIEITDATIAHEIIDHYPNPQPDRNIKLRFDYLEKICGKSFNHEAVKTLMKALGFSIVEETAETLTIAIPNENPDIYQPADLAEEVLRIDGLNNIPISKKLHYTLNKSNSKQDYRHLKERIAEYLAYSGLQEIITNSITNSQYYTNHKHLVYLVNSLSSELDVMRPEMLEGGLEVIAYNQNRKMNGAHLFEIGNTYKNLGSQEFEQTEWLSIWFTGNFRPQHWQQPQEASDIYLLKGLMTSIFTFSGLKKVKEISENNILTWQLGHQIIAQLQPVSKEDLKKFGIKQTVFYASVNLSNLFNVVKNNTIKYASTTKYPLVKRDLALVIPKSISYESISEIARKQKWEALQDFELFDIFEHERIGKNNKSMALSFTFQLKDRTLTDTEVDSMMNKLMKDYQTQLNATIRS